MSTFKAQVFKTKDLGCEVEIPPPEIKEPFEVTFMNFGWHFTVALSPKDLDGLVRFLEECLDIRGGSLS